jgi:hypothetical protein
MLMLFLAVHRIDGLPIFQPQLAKHAIHRLHHARFFRSFRGMPGQREVHERLLAARRKARREIHFSCGVGGRLGREIAVRRCAEFVSVARHVADEPAFARLREIAREAAHAGTETDLADHRRRNSSLLIADDFGSPSVRASSAGDCHVARGTSDVSGICHVDSCATKFRMLERKTTIFSRLHVERLVLHRVTVA